MPRRSDTAAVASTAMPTRRPGAAPTTAHRCGTASGTSTSSASTLYSDNDAHDDDHRALDDYVLARARHQRRVHGTGGRVSDTRVQQSRIAESLAARGIDARVAGSAAPYRVRVGRVRHTGAGGGRRGASQGEEAFRVRDGGRSRSER